MNVRLLVYLNRNAERPCFERMFTFDSSIRFPFEELFKTQKVLFGSDCVVVIEMV